MIGKRETTVAADAERWGLRGISLVGMGLLGLALVACGGGSGSDDSDVGDSGGTGSDGSITSTGIFVDSPVEGLRYVTNSIEGQTDAGVRFNYRAGETVRFFVGDVLIGEVTGALELSPIDLVPGARNENDPTVTNIARFLQTIDDDGNPSNGIRITDVVADLARGEAINFNQSISAFENDGAVQVLVSSLTSATPAGARSLVAAGDAQAHLRGSLLGLLEGNWAGNILLVAESAPYTGDRCEWNLSGAIDGSGGFTFSSSLTRTTGIGRDACGSGSGSGQWYRSGSNVTFDILSSTTSIIGGYTFNGEITDEGQRITIGGRGVEEGIEFSRQIVITRQ